MSATTGWKPNSTSFADEVAGLLGRWSVLRPCRPACGSGQAWAVGDLQVIHLPSSHEAELRLTAAVITRMRSTLIPSQHLIGTLADPADDWVRLRLEGAQDVQLIVSLASVAISANTDNLPGVHQPDDPCPRLRRLAAR